MYDHSSMDDPKEGIKLGCQCAEFTFGAETTGRPGLYQPFDVFFLKWICSYLCNCYTSAN